MRETRGSARTPLQWARLRTEGLNPLRRGAWYRVVNVAREAVTVDINRQPVAVPRAVVELIETSPERWTVVPRPPRAVRLPPSCGDRYGVCPGCRHRTPLDGSPQTVRCPRCNGLFPVAWDERYLGRN